MLTGAGKPMKVFIPYHKSWLAEVSSSPSLLDTVGAPSKNPSSANNDLFKLVDPKVPSPPPNKRFVNDDERKRIRKIWLAGHEAGMKCMTSFLSSIDEYASTHSNPATDSTSRMSPYFAASVVSVREAFSHVQKHNSGNAAFSSSGSSVGVVS